MDVLRLPAVLALATLLAAPAAQAQTVTINPSTDFAQVANLLNVDVASLEQQLDDEIRALYGLLDVQEFLRLSANAQTLVLAGSGADYASNPTGFFAGFGVNAAVNAGDADLRDFQNYDVERALPVSGGAMLTLMLGYNFADQGAPWLTLSAHGLHFPLSSQQLEGEFTNVGAHVQVNLFRPEREEDFVPVYWGGLALTGGFSYARSTLNLTDSYEANTPLSDGVLLETVSMGQLRLEQTAYTVPLEITSNLTFFEILTIFGGFGVDIPLGDASVFLDLETELTGRSGDLLLDIGNAVLAVSEEVDADDFLPRAMLGVQVNLWLLHAFVQLNISTRDTSLGLASGLRVTF